MMGIKEEIKGKLTRNPERVQHGREIKTGEERQKKITGEVSTLSLQILDGLLPTINVRTSPIPSQPPMTTRTRNQAIRPPRETTNFNSESPLQPRPLPTTLPQRTALPGKTTLRGQGQGLATCRA